MHAYFRFVLRHRILVLVACGVITILAGLSVSRASLGSSLLELIMGDSPQLAEYMTLAEEFGSDMQLIVAFEEPTLGDPATRDRLRSIVDRVTVLPDVARVHSVLDIAGDPASDPFASGLLASRDGRRTAVVVVLGSGDYTALERAPQLVDSIVEPFVEAGYPRETLHLGGMLSVLSAVQKQMLKNIFRITPLVGLVLLAATWLLFRRLWPVALTMAVGTLAIAWTMGLAIQVDRQVSILLAIAPSLILLISFSDVVHLCSAYLLELSEGRDKDEAIEKSASEVGTACVFTSITTFVGFIGLTLINVPAFRQMGWVLGFGVAVALILAMTLCPIAFSYMGAPKSWHGRGAGDAGRLDRVLRVFEQVAKRRPWPVIAAFAVVAGVAIYGITQIRVECDLAGRMSESTEFRRGLAYLDEHFAGANVIDLYVETPSDAGLLGQLAKIMQFRQRLETLDTVGKVLPQEVRGTRARLSMIVHETGMAASFELGEEARRIGAEVLGDEAVVRPTGLAYLGGSWLDTHVRAQRTAVLISFAVIALVMVVLFRSLSMGLWSMVPNLVPLLVLGGILGLGWRVVDSDMALPALIAIGIAVDDTIHFLSRYRLHRNLSDTFRFAGRAIVITSIIFAAGFAPFALSDYAPIAMLGLLVPIVMLTALLADLLLLPALISVGAISTGNRGAVD